MLRSTIVIAVSLLLATGIPSSFAETAEPSMSMAPSPSPPWCSTTCTDKPDKIALCLIGRKGDKTKCVDPEDVDKNRFNRRGEDIGTKCGSCSTEGFPNNGPEQPWCNVTCDGEPGTIAICQEDKKGDTKTKCIDLKDLEKKSDPEKDTCGVCDTIPNQTPQCLADGTECGKKGEECCSGKCEEVEDSDGRYLRRDRNKRGGRDDIFLFARGGAGDDKRKKGKRSKKKQCVANEV